MVNKTMSNLQKVTRVSNLKEATTISNSDVLLVETATETLKVTKGNLLKEVNEELNAKSDANHTHDEYVTESELNSKGLATEMFVTNKIAEAQLGNNGGNMDLSGYATTEYVDQEVGKTNAQLSEISVEKDKRGYLLSNFHMHVVNGDWTPAVHEAIRVANENGGYVLVDGMYEIKSGITIPTNTTIEGFGFSYGVCGFYTNTPSITAVEIRGVAITFKNLVIKATKRFDEETHGVVFSSSNLPDTNRWHAFCNIRDVRIYNFNGYGIKFDSIHDSLVENISVERCGNANCYAFFVGSTDDTSNHTNFNRIQVEQCYTKAMYVDISTLCCVFTNIHSERVLEVDQSIYTHKLSGGRCTYINARIENSSSNVDEQPRLALGGAGCTYETFSGDASITSIIETNRIFGYFKFCNLRNVSYKNIATANFIHCSINGISFSGETIEMNGCTVSNMTLGASTLVDKYFKNCTFIDLGYNSAFYKGNFLNCIFKTSENSLLKLSPKCSFDNCKFYCTTKLYYDRDVIIRESLLEDFEISGSNASVTLINNIITTFARGANQDNSLKWINNLYDGDFTKENKDLIVLLKDNR